MWLFPLICMGVLGIAFGAGLAYASKKFSVEVDPKIKALIDILPGANCGACGYPGCSGFASSVVSGEAAPNLCSPGGAETIEKIAEILGVEVSAAEPETAFINCAGAKDAVKDSNYAGVQSCALAALISNGPIACKNACLMMGDCMDVCPFDAITWSPGQIPVIIEEKCTACGKCVKICAKGIIKMRPKSKRVLVLCSSQDKGGVARKACKVACIACTKCVKECPVEAIVIENNCAIIDTEKCILCGKCVPVCPTNAIWDGRPPKKNKKVAVNEEAT